MDIMNPHTILIIEDDDFLRSLAATKIKKAGFTVDIAADGQIGLEKLRTLKPNLLLLDLMLPVVDGFQVLQAMKAEGLLATTKIIVFSNLGSEEDIQKTKEYNITDYIVKSSFTLDELVQKIESVLK
jgi:DNA-binding response OmpR family regulator